MRRFFKYIGLFAILSFLLPTLSLCAETPQVRLQRIRGEIDSLAAVLENIQKSERSLASQVETLGQQIAARMRLLNELEASIYEERKVIKRYDSDIIVAQRKKKVAFAGLSRANDDVDALEDLIRRRTVFVYKHGGREAMRFLLAANDPGDLFRRRIYVRRIQERDQRNLIRLREAKERQAQLTASLDRSVRELTTARNNKTAAVKRSEELITETRKEQNRLTDDRKGISTLLEDIRDDHEAVLALIESREQSAGKVEEWVATLERQRTGGVVREIQVGPRSTAEVIVRAIPTFDSFSDARGRLPWPVNGKVIRRFGLERNKITGTLTENPGVDISAREGNEVLAVHGGVCTRITYLRGFGTTMLVEHGDGYYTVYAHLGDIWVSEGENVLPGRVLGTVGDSATLDSPRLHFQIWHKRKNEDPLKWLG